MKNKNHLQAAIYLLILAFINAEKGLGLSIIIITLSFASIKFICHCHQQFTLLRTASTQLQTELKQYQNMLSQTTEHEPPDSS